MENICKQSEMQSTSLPLIVENVSVFHSLTIDFFSWKLDVHAELDGVSWVNYSIFIIIKVVSCFVLEAVIYKELSIYY